MRSKFIIFSCDGFSLVTVLVTAFVLAVGIIALLRIFSINPFVTASTDRISRATNYAQYKIEEFRSIGYDPLIDSINAGYTTGIDTIGNIIRRYDLYIDTLNTIRIDVRCYWQPLPAGGGDTVRLITNLSNHG